MLITVFAVALAAAVQPPPEPAMPTTIERGLIDRACRSAAPEASGQCRDEKLTALRTDFGKDLAKLRPDDRKRVDGTCSPLLKDSALKGRDPYFDCMLEQLAALKAARTKRPANAGAAPAAATPADAPAAADAPAETPAAPAPASGGSSTMMIAAVVGVVAIVGGLGFVVMRKRGPKMRKCTRCGQMAVPGDSDSEMCPHCRQEVESNYRKGKAEQAEQARLAADEAKREQERQAARREQQRMRELEEKRVREYEEKKAREHAEKMADAVRPNEPQPEPPSPFDAQVFDPHAILGVAKNATSDAITAAYQAAKKKYDPELVVHLSEEVQQHYREKAEAVEKAFQTLCGGSQPA